MRWEKVLWCWCGAPELHSIFHHDWTTLLCACYLEGLCVCLCALGFRDCMSLCVCVFSGRRRGGWERPFWFREAKILHPLQSERSVIYRVPDCVCVCAFIVAGRGTLIRPNGVTGPAGDCTTAIHPQQGITTADWGALLFFRASKRSAAGERCDKQHFTLWASQARLFSCRTYAQ